MQWLDDLKRFSVHAILKTETAMIIHREHEEASKRKLEGTLKRFPTALLSNCQDLDTRSLIALAVATAQEIQNGLILGNIVRVQHEKGHPGAHLNTFDDVLFSRSEPVDVNQPDGPKFYDLLGGKEIQGRVHIPLTHHGVSVAPWNVKRLIGNLPYYGAQRPWEEHTDHEFEVLWPIPVIWVFNGNHSFTAGILNKTGFVKAGNGRTALKDITQLFEHAYCDGTRMRRLSDDSPLERLHRSPLPWDVRWGLLFELGRLISAKNGWIEAMDTWCVAGMNAQDQFHHQDEGFGSPLHNGE
jgi:hypothetical protein